MHLSELKNGDLIAWRRTGTGTHTNSSFWMNLVRLATASDYGHVSIYWHAFGQHRHVEAVAPKISLNTFKKGEAFVIPMGLDLDSREMMVYFDDKLGAKYSFLDAIRAYLGLVPKAKNRWQCAELSLDFYRSHGLDLDPKALTPTKLVRAALKQTKGQLHHLELD